MGRGRGGDEKGEVSSQAIWDQGGQGHITPKEGFQVSKRGIKKEVNGELARGVKKGSCAITCVINLYMCI
jgi:hypothetical protein